MYSTAKQVVCVSPDTNSARKGELYKSDKATRAGNRLIISRRIPRDEGRIERPIRERERKMPGMRLRARIAMMAPRAAAVSPAGIRSTKRLTLFSVEREALARARYCSSKGNDERHIVAYLLRPRV